MIYKLKMLAEDDGELLTLDLYFDLTNVNGFYIPLPSEDEEHLGETINLIINGETITVIQEPNIINYLTEKFIDKVIK